MAAPSARTIHVLMRRRRYTCSANAERAREEHRISVAQLEEALSSAEIVGEHEKFAWGPAYWLLGFSEGRAIHALCTVKERPREILVLMLI